MLTLSKSHFRNFKILHLTDLHMLPNEWKEGHEVRESVVNTINRLVKETSPDLITHGGDFSAAEYPESYTKFAEFLDSFEIPWTTVWGNHDNQCGEGITRRYAEEFLTYKNFVYEHGPRELGNGNFVLAIKQGERYVHSLILMDSHDRAKYVDNKGDVMKVYARLSGEQIEWYKENVRNLCAIGCNSSTIMCHTPIYAFKAAFKLVYNHSFADPKNIEYKDSFNSECWYEPYKNSFGVRYEGECCYPEDDGVLDAIKELGSTKLVVCGHDHVNCTCIEIDGVKMLYGLKTGRGSYFDERLNGGTLIEIDSEGNVYPKHLFVDL